MGVTDEQNRAVVRGQGAPFQNAQFVDSALPPDPFKAPILVRLDICCREQYFPPRKLIRHLHGQHQQNAEHQCCTQGAARTLLPARILMRSPLVKTALNAVMQGSAEQQCNGTQCPLGSGGQLGQRVAAVQRNGRPMGKVQRVGHASQPACQGIGEPDTARDFVGAGQYQCGAHAGNQCQPAWKRRRVGESEHADPAEGQAR